MKICQLLAATLLFAMMSITAPSHSSQISTQIPLHGAQTPDPGVTFLNSKQAGASNLPFSEIVRVGNLLFLSGQVGLDRSTGKLVPGGMAAEAKQTMNNIKGTLESHGYAMADIVKCTIMLADISEWAAFNAVYVRYFSKPFPARSAFGANGLAFNAKLEVECIAAVKNK